MLSILALAVAPALVAPSPRFVPRFVPGGGGARAAADRRPCGLLRHVQLLGVSEDEPRTVRFVTASRQGLALFERPLSGPVELGEPDAFLATSFELLPTWTWRERVPWRVVEADGDSFLVAHDAALESPGGVERVVVLRFPGGEEVADLPAGTSVEDARVSAGTLEILFLRSGTVELAGVDLQSGTVERREVFAAESASSSARFVANDDDPGDGDEIVVAAWASGEVRASVVDLTTCASWRLEPELRDEEARALRVAASRSGDRLRIAIGAPDFDGGRGTARLLTSNGAGEPLVRTDLWPFGESFVPGRGARETYAYGHAVEFVGEDRDDLAVACPLAPIAEHVDVFAADAGAFVDRLQPGSPWFRFGSSLSVGPRGRHVLVAGGQVSYPELFRMPGEAVLFDLAGTTSRVASFVASAAD